MKRFLLPFGSVCTLLAVLVSVSGCGSADSMLQPTRVDYGSAKLRPSLEVPPDLGKLDNNQNYYVPGASVTASQYDGTIDNTSISRAIVKNTVGDVTMQRQGDHRWLVVNRSPEQIWSTVEDFWQEVGFVLVLDEPSLGILETDWAENRAKIPDDFIRRTLGKVLDSVYSTGERDKFRTRLEIDSAGKTEIFITHRGVEEVYASSNKDTTVWQPRNADPELEAEMLRRLMVRLGATEEQSQKAVAQTPSLPERAHITQVDGKPALRLDENFDNAWRWIGISLDRISFTVVDRDRSRGIYQVRYVNPVVDSRESEKGLLSGLFGKGKKAPPASNYQVKLTQTAEPGQTLIQILSETGAPTDEKIASHIIKALADDLN